MYRQVFLKRGTTGQVVWIERRLAVVGRHVRIGSEDGWLVKSAGAICDGQYLTTDGRDYRKEFGSLT